MAELTYSEMSQLLKYEPESGKLFWLPRPLSMCPTEGYWRAVNARFAGKEAFTAMNGNGYRRGRIWKRNYYAQRVSWLLHYGEWPSGTIDHIDGDTDNNRIVNLRDVPHAENMRNRKKQSSNTSGATGVTWHPQAKKWRSAIVVNDKRIDLGLFADFELACEARKRSLSVYGFSDRHGG